jgi:hypothetical protein
MQAMRRVLHHALSICAAISLVMCVAACVLWVRSYWIGNRLLWYDRPHWAQVWSNEGLVRVCVGKVTSLNYSPPGHWLLGEGTVAGFGYRRWERKIDDVRQHARIVTFPYWFALLLLSALPAMMCSRWYRLRACYRRGHCRCCGYDLRAHGTGDRCPECGTVAAADAVSRALVRYAVGPEGWTQQHEARPFQTCCPGHGRLPRAG